MEQTAKVGLGAIDRIVLVTAWLVTCTAVYGLGFYTGSQTQDRLRDDEDRVVRLPISEEPPPVGERAKAADDLTFWGVLEPGGRRSKPGEGIPAQHPQASLAAEPAAPPDEPASRPAKSRRTGSVSARPGSPARKPGVAAAKPTGKAAAPGARPPAPRVATGGTTTAKPVASSGSPRPVAAPRAREPRAPAPATDKPRARQPAGAARPATPPASGTTAAAPPARPGSAGARERSAVARSGVPPE